MTIPTRHERFAREVGKYPPEQGQSAVMACLAIVQHETGYVGPEGEREVASYLGKPVIAVHEVATFYGMYNQRPVGRYKLDVCTNVACMLRGGKAALQHLERCLGTASGATTVDGLFTLREAECLGACADAPVLLVNDRMMCSFMEPARLDALVDALRGEAPPR